MTPQTFPFSKNRYFPRKRMRSADFIREQTYVEHKLAFLSQWDFGAGVALGLDVQRIDGDSLLVSPGFAVDGYGRWLIVDEPAICRIRTLHGLDALHGETALLWLAYHEEHTDPMFVPGDQGEVREYAAARERFSFYLTDMRLLPEAVGRSTLFSDVILFEDEDLRIRQVIPRILPGHGLVQIRLIIESFRAEPLDIVLQYNPELPGIQAAEGGQPLGFDQAIRLQPGETTLALTGKLDTTAQAVLLSLPEKGFLLEKRGLPLRAQLHFREEFPVVSGDPLAALERRLLSQDPQELWNTGAQEGVPLAGVRLLRCGDQVMLDSVFPLAQSQRTVLPCLKERLSDCGAFFPPPLPAERPAAGDLTPAAALSESQRQMATGTVILNAGLHLQEGNILCSDEIAHELGPGAVFIEFGIENVYMDTADGQAFQYLESDGETVYAILSYEKGGETLQRLVALSLDNTAMRARSLTELTTLRGAPAGVIWEEIYLPAESEGTGEPEEGGAETEIRALTLSGLDGQGQSFLAHVDLETGRVGFETVLPEESVLFLKYIADGHYVWINQDKEAGQYQNGAWQRDILAGLSDTPLHISTCGTRCFISDSISGDVFEIFPEGAPARFRQGEDFIGGSGFQYRQLEVYTTYQSQSGNVRLVGLCAAEDGGVIAGEDYSVRELHTGALRLRMLWQHGWLAVLVFWAVLAALVESVFSILYSPRLSVRLLLCQVLAAAVLLSGVTAVQYHSFQEAVREEAYQKLRLIGGSLATVLSSSEEPGDSASVELAVHRLERQVSMAMDGQDREYAICVVWDTDLGPVIASDSASPAGYLLEDVKSRDYVSAVSHALRQGKGLLERIQTDTSCDYLYAQPFSQGGRAGCIAISQNEEVLLAGQAKFLQRLLPLLAVCPLLFLALAWITRRLLRPLDEIQRALEEFYTRGSGGQMQLCGMPHTELYEVGRVFNQLSIQTRVQFNELKSINGAYARLVPDCLLRMLHKDSVTELSAGDHAPVNGALLILIPRGFSPDRTSLDRMTGLAAERIAQSGGMLVDYDEGLYALTALLPEAEHARSCARDCLEQLEQNRMPVMAAVLSETVELGVFGGDSLLYSLAVSKDMRRKQAALERALDFDALVVENTRAGRTGLRLLGWDNGMELYEDPACRPSDWQSRWRETAGTWEKALRLFRERDFSTAMRLFAKVLRRMPEDKAARWYLFRCDTLRDSAAQDGDTGLLFDWGEGWP